MKAPERTFVMMGFRSPFIHIGIVVALLVMYAACDTLGNDEPDELSEPTGKIVFAVQPGDENYQIYSMGIDGTDLRQLTFADEPFHAAYFPSWSPDGERIVFASTRGAPMGLTVLYVMQEDGSEMHPLINNPHTGQPQFGSNPVWSPDGKKVAFDFCVDCQGFGKNTEIFVADLEAGTVTQLTEHPAKDKQPTWSPDSRRIAFESRRDYYQADTLRTREDLYVVNIDGSNLERLTEDGTMGEIIWSPTGSHLVYGQDNFETSLFLLNTTSKETIPLNVELPFGRKLFPSSWSPDGRQLFLMALDYPNYTFHLFDMETGEVKDIPFEPEPVLGSDWFAAPKTQP